MKKAINYWSFPGGLEGTKDIKACLQEAKNAGFEGVELGFYKKGTININSTKADMETILAIADKIGIAITSLGSVEFWGMNFSLDDKAVNQEAATYVQKMLELASYLKVDTILVVPGAVDVFFDPKVPVIPYQKVYERTSEWLKRLAPAAEKYQVNIAIENVWNRFLPSPIEFRDFLDQIGSEYVGAYFDVGNSVLGGYPEHWIRILGKRIKKVHFKDFRRAVGTDQGFVDLLEGDVNWPEVMKAFKEVGYDDYVTAEMIPLYHYYPEVRIQNTSNAMDKILGRK